MLNKGSVTVLLAREFQWWCFTNPNVPNTSFVSAHSCASVNGAWEIHAFPSVGNTWWQETNNNRFERKSLSIIYSSSVTPMTFCHLFYPCVASDPTMQNQTCVRSICRVCPWGASEKVWASWLPRGQALKSLKPVSVYGHRDPHAHLKHGPWQRNWERVHSQSCLGFMFTSRSLTTV